MSNNLHEMGLKRIRRIGHNTDFEQIKDYIPGDDYRTINWRATARRHQLMVNQYQEERSQPVYSVIDKGRMMQQAFAGMTLLDYAINAALVLSYVAVRKEDKAGLVTFSDGFDTFVSASNQPGHIRRLQEALYAEQTQFAESDFSALLVGLSHRVSRRSLMVLYTSFTGLVSLRRQLPYLRRLPAPPTALSAPARPAPPPSRGLLRGRGTAHALPAAIACGIHRGLLSAGHRREVCLRAAPHRSGASPLRYSLPPHHAPPAQHQRHQQIPGNQGKTIASILKRNAPALRVGARSVCKRT